MVQLVNNSDEKLIDQLQVIFNEVYDQKDGLKKEFLFNPYTQVYIDVEDGQIVGLIHINAIYDRYEINNLFVLEDFRSKGIASKLMEKVIEEGQNKKIQNITLEVRIDNCRAISLYKKYGFVAKSVRKSYYNGIDGVLMEKEMM